MTPTTNFRVFSGTRDKGRWTAKPIDQHQHTGRRRAQAGIADHAAAGADGDDDEDDLDTLQQHGLESRGRRQEIGPPVGRLALQLIGLGGEGFASSWMAMKPAARRIALRSQRMPKRISSTPMANCRRCSGMRLSSGPRARIRAPRTARPSSIPVKAGRQLRDSLHGEDDGEGLDDLDEGGEEGGRDRGDNGGEAGHHGLRFCRSIEVS